ncbi:hypothetical protein HN924_00170 [Candidatus Woesearchaeota archaeon]|jgi:hypothetical protein|nr:hypothetical protein [Candidatus Woesearchaeota archaeon]MBT7402816.1 hypothetical protein [Candidatus Woesearchaeota archaeon]
MKIAKIIFVVMITLFVVSLGFNLAVADCPGDITINTPEDGDIISGDDYEITWSDPQCDSGEEIELYYCYYTASSMCRLIDSVDANDMEYDWDTISMDETREYWLEANIGDGLVLYESNNMFKIDNSAPDRVPWVTHDGPDENKWHYDESNNPEVTFQWGAASDDGPAEIVKYTAYCSGEGSTILPATARDHTCNFDDGQLNYFWVFATDSAGNIGNFIIYGPYWFDTVNPYHTSDSALDLFDGDTYMKVGDKIDFVTIGATDDLSGIY